MKNWQLILMIYGLFILDVSAIFFQRHFQFSGGENFALVMCLFFLNLGSIIIMDETKIK